MMSAAPGRHRPQADGLWQATDSLQGLSVSGLSPKQRTPPRGGRAWTQMVQWTVCAWRGAVPLARRGLQGGREATWGLT